MSKARVIITAVVIEGRSQFSPRFETATGESSSGKTPRPSTSEFAQTLVRLRLNSSGLLPDMCFYERADSDELMS